MSRNNQFTDDIDWDIEIAEVDEYFIDDDEGYAYDDYEEYDEEPTRRQPLKSKPELSGILVLGRRKKTDDVTVDLHVEKKETSWTEVGRVLSETQSDDESDIEIDEQDDIGFMTGEQFYSRKLPITSKQVGRVEMFDDTVVETEKDIRTKSTQKLNDIYNKDGSALEVLWSRVVPIFPSVSAVAPLPQQPLTKRPILPRQAPLKKSASAPTPVSKPDSKKLTRSPKMMANSGGQTYCILTSDLEIRLPELYEDIVETEESETGTEESKIPIEEPINPELANRVNKRMAEILRKQEERKQKWEQAKQEKRDSYSPVSVVQKKSNKPAKTKADKNKLKMEFFGNSKSRQVDTKAVLLKSIDTKKSMAIYSKLIMQNPEEMRRCIDNADHQIPLPQLIDQNIIAASPTQLNIIRTTIVPVPLCKMGVECFWFKKKAYLALGEFCPKEYHTAYPCNYSHIGYQQLEIQGSAFVQCIVPNCTNDADHHYINGAADSHIIHITPSTEDCLHDKRNYCMNVFGDGCYRKHVHAGPLMLSMIMRHEFSKRTIPASWPVYDGKYLFKTSRSILETKVPIKGVNDTIEKRLKYISGIWPKTQ